MGKTRISSGRDATVSRPSGQVEDASSVANRTPSDVRAETEMIIKAGRKIKKRRLKNAVFLFKLQMT